MSDVGFLLIHFFRNKGQILFQQHGPATLGHNVFDLFCIGHLGAAELGNPGPLERLLAHGGRWPKHDGAFVLLQVFQHGIDGIVDNAGRRDDRRVALG